MVEPDAAVQEAYGGVYPLYRELYERTADIAHTLARRAEGDT